jgi:hypothetical protein
MTAKGRHARSTLTQLDVSMLFMVAKSLDKVLVGLLSWSLWASWSDTIDGADTLRMGSSVTPPGK